MSAGRATGRGGTHRSCGGGDVGGVSEVGGGPADWGGVREVGGGPLGEVGWRGAGEGGGLWGQGGVP